MPAAIDIRSIAVESRGGQLAYAAYMLARSRLVGNDYLRGMYVLRAWRASNTRPVSRFAERLTHNLRLGRTGLSSNPLLRAFVDSPRAVEIRDVFARYPLYDRVRLRQPLKNDSPARQGDLVVLKPWHAGSGEKGVLLVKYTESFARFAAVFRVEDLARRYMIVLEPSWWGYKDVDFLLFSSDDAQVVVQSPSAADHSFLADSSLGLRPVRVGAGDWIDASLFAPAADDRSYDLVMVSSWNPFKRHADLLAAVSWIKSTMGKRLRVALLGYPNGWTSDNIHEMIDQHGLTEQCDVFDSVPQQEVARVVGSSRLYVLLSRREGANKAMYEAMFCDTPVLVPSDHRGINHDHVNASTGSAFERGRLGPAIMEALEHDSYSPREWALSHTGFEAATRILDDELRKLSEASGLPWTTSIVAKKNEPNLRYVHDDDRIALEAEYSALAEFLRPSRSPTI